jgi:hypothetical protein
MMLSVIVKIALLIILRVSLEYTLEVVFSHANAERICAFHYVYFENMRKKGGGDSLSFFPFLHRVD